jgi:calcineurin-like phosphoesterase
MRILFIGDVVGDKGVSNDPSLFTKVEAKRETTSDDCQW